MVRMSVTIYSFICLTLGFVTQQGNSYNAFDRDCVKTHNELRKLHSAPALTWSARLAKEARDWAEALATRDKVLHDYKTMIRNGEGENIAWFKPAKRKCRGPKDKHCFTCRDVVLRWYREINNYNFTARDAIDKATPIKHFTQIVWRNTRELGVGSAISLNHGVIVVARYTPIGDTDGLAGYVGNVIPPGGNSESADLVLHGNPAKQDIPGAPKINLELQGQPAGQASRLAPAQPGGAATTNAQPQAPAVPAVPTAATPVPTEMPVTCGQRRQSRIVGGEEAYPGAWPWQVGLKLSPEEDIFCGGSLIKKQWVVTASHCVWDFLKRKTIPPLQVIFGEFDKDNAEGQEITSKVDKVIMHQKYSHETLDYDIALLRLETPLEEFSQFVRPICLPDKTTKWDPGHQCHVTGFGLTQEGGNVAPVLMQAKIPLVAQEICKKTYKGKEQKFSDRMLCAGFAQGGIDACQGDSGGPLTCKFETRWYLTGVVSWGVGCANPNAYGVYSNVTVLRDWIDSTLEKHKQPSE